MRARTDGVMQHAPISDIIKCMMLARNRCALDIVWHKPKIDLAFLAYQKKAVRRAAAFGI